jgi:hypothetical protein
MRAKVDRDLLREAVLRLRPERSEAARRARAALLERYCSVLAGQPDGSIPEATP